MNNIIFFILVSLIGLFFPKPVHAYIDPGTGSYLWQVMIGFFLGGAFTIKLYWKKIAAFLKKEKNNDKKENSSKLL